MVPCVAQMGHFSMVDFQSEESANGAGWATVRRVLLYTEILALVAPPILGRLLARCLTATLRNPLKFNVFDHG